MQGIRKLVSSNNREIAAVREHLQLLKKGAVAPFFCIASGANLGVTGPTLC